ncbi:MAG: histidine kinase [Chloroflexota bacterium]
MYDNHTDIIDEQQRRGRLVLRSLPLFILPLLVVAFTTIVIHLVAGRELPPRGTPNELLPLVGIVVISIFFTALITLVRLGRSTASAVLLVTVWTFFMIVAGLGGSISSFGPAFIIIPICAAGLLLDGVASIAITIVATLLIGFSAWMEFQGILISPRPTEIGEVYPLFAASFWIAIFWTVGALTYLLAGHLKQALRQSRAQATALRELSTQLEHRVAEQTAELAQRAERAEALHEVSRALTSTLNLNQMLSLITDQAAQLLRCHSALVITIQEDEQRLIFLGPSTRPFSNGGSSHMLDQLTSDGGSIHIIDRLPEHEDMLIGILEQNESRMVQLALDETDDPIKILVQPMQYGTSVKGALVLIDPANGEYQSDDDLKLTKGLADQAAVAMANAQLIAQLQETATLEERNRLAREIHDTLAQGLTGIVVQLGAAQRAIAATAEETTEHIDLAQRMAREALAEARRSVWNLRAPMLEQGDLTDALQGLVSRPLRPETTASFVQRGTRQQLPPSIESALLRVCQEALVNVAKHAEASHVQVILTYDTDTIQLTISDNGRGIDERVLTRQTEAIGPWGGFGLLGMRERISALGGHLELLNDNGTQVTATVPLTQQPSEPSVMQTLRPVIGEQS